MQTTRFRIIGISFSLVFFGFSIWLVAAFGSLASFSSAVSVWAIAFVILMLVLSMWLLIVSIVADGEDVKRVLSAFEAGDAFLIVMPVFLYQVTKKIFRAGTSSGPDRP